VHVDFNIDERRICTVASISDLSQQGMGRGVGGAIELHSNPQIRPVDQIASILRFQSRVIFERTSIHAWVGASNSVR